MEKNIVVLGANGFIGSHLVNGLAKLPDTQIICFDRFSRAQAFEDSENITAISGDFFSDEDIDRALKYGGYLIHCLSSSNPSVSKDNPYIDIELLNRDVEIFDRSTRAGNFEKIAYVSSGGTVYGDASSDSPAQESGPANPKSSYGIAKLATEQYLQYLSSKEDIRRVIYRLTNPYGPGQVLKNGQGVIPAFIGKMEAGEPITVVGDGESSRDYVYIDDAVDMMVNLLLADNKHDIYNIGSGTQTTINELISTLSQVIGKQPEVLHIEEPATYVKTAAVSIDRYTHEFGTPKSTSLEEGLSQTTGILSSV